MKTLRRIALVVALIVSMLIPNFSQVAQAASYVANWGQRDVVATYLSQAAKDFYTGNEEYSVVSKKSGGTTIDNVADSDLYKALHNLMKSHHTHETNYDETKDLYKYTDCVNGDISKLSCFYSGNMLQGEWSTGGKIWNREHTWPDSKGLNGNDENDIMMLRPTTSSLNGDRSNTAYGESDGYYNPTKNGQDIRGDVSRIALYIYTRWENTKYMWGSTGVIESLPLLLTWMEEDPVDTWELGRNDAVQSITGTRNVFVDYPEYAWLLFGYAVPNEMQTPSNNAKNGLAGGENLPQAPEYKPETPEVDASLEELLAKDSLTIPEVYVVASANPVTDKKFYVTGVITDILDTNYGNMYIKDSSGKSLLVYGCYNADGSVSYGSMT
ncbi:MAG: endonuclease, partial [Clostridia bacterium]|nr:endonuclease [Clostridia bacterium]